MILWHPPNNMYPICRRNSKPAAFVHHYNHHSDTKEKIHHQGRLTQYRDHFSCAAFNHSGGSNNIDSWWETAVKSIEACQLKMRTYIITHISIFIMKLTTNHLIPPSPQWSQISKEPALIPKQPLDLSVQRSPSLSSLQPEMWTKQIPLPVSTVIYSCI